MTDAEVLDVLWEWCVAVLGSAGVAFDDADRRIVVKVENGVRPALPYLKLATVSTGNVIGMDEPVDRWNPDTEQVERTFLGSRYDVLEVQGFGEQAGAWLRELSLRHVHTLAGRAVARARKVVIKGFTSPRKVAVPLDTSAEYRFISEVRVTYTVLSSTPETVPVAERVDVNLDLTAFSGDPAPVSGDVSLDLTIPVE